VVVVTPPPTVRACTGFPTSVAAPARTGPAFQSTITVKCAPDGGRNYFLVIQLNNVPPKGTTNYYEKVEIPQTPGTYTYTLNVSGTAPGISRYLFIASADSEEATQLEEAQVDGLPGSLPQGTQIVSATIKSTRVS
jgi:hypothetical protein